MLSLQFSELMGEYYSCIVVMILTNLQVLGPQRVLAVLVALFCCRVAVSLRCVVWAA